jgi:DNA-binding MarR family transcriptional regulator
MHRNLLLNLLRGVYWFDDALQENMEIQGYAPTTRAISFILLNIAHGERRAINIARNLGVSRQAVSKMLIDLQRSGMLEMREDPEDQRSKILEFSAKFAKRGAACAEVLAQLEREVGRRVGRGRFQAMCEALSHDWGAWPRLASPNRSQVHHGRQIWQGSGEVQDRGATIQKPARVKDRGGGARRQKDDTRSVTPSRRKASLK